MDTIREYLDNLFRGFPETPEVLQAKAELLEMMEDKYEECLQEGKTEKEAVGIVISEFGNMEELAEELGIADYLHKKSSEKDGSETEDSGFQAGENTYQKTGGSGGYGSGGQGYPSDSWSFTQAHQYVAYAWKHGLMIGGGVACFILSCFLNSILDAFGDYTFLPSLFTGFLGNTFFMGGVAAGVLILIFAGRLEKTYPVVKKRRRILVDMETAEYMKKQRAADEEKCFRMRLIGILLLVFLWMPGAFSDTFFGFWPLLEEIADNSTLLMIAAGVGLIIVSASVENRYQEFAKAAVVSEDGFEYGSGFGTGGRTGDGQVQEDFGAWQNGGADNRVFEGYRKKKRGWVPAVIITAAVLFTIVFFAVRIVLFAVGFVRPKSAAISEMVSETTEEEVQHGSYAPGDVNNIQIDLDTEDVLVQTGDTEEITMDYRGKGKIKENLNEGVLELKERGKSGWFHLHFWNFVSGEHGKLVLTLPKSIYESAERLDGKKKISIDTDTGDVQMKDVCFSGISIDADTGDVTLSKVAGVDSGVSIDADTGDVRLSDVTGGQITVDADTGDVTVSMAGRSHFNGLECDLDTGDFLMQVPMSREGFLETFSVDFSADLKKRIQFFGDKMSSGEISGNAAGGTTLVKVSVDVGNITVEQKQ